MVDERDAVRDLGAADDAESDALIALFQSLGGRVEDLSGPQDMVATMAALALRPPGPRYSFAEGAERAHVPVELAGRLWSGLGLVSDATPLSDDDVSTLQMLGAAVELVGEAGAIELSRVGGLAARRLAEVLASLTRVGFEVPRHQARLSRLELARGYFDLIGEEVPSVVGVIDTALRHHLIGVAARAWSPDSTETVATRTVTVGFADLVGFTDWTASASMAELAAAVDAFEAAVWEAADQTGIEIVKLIGDEVMFAAPTTKQALAGARALLAMTSAHRSIEGVRIGLSSGEAITRAGDLFGTVVNEASRLAGAADPGVILLAAGAVDEIARAMVSEAIEIDAKGFAEPIVAYRVLDR